MADLLWQFLEVCQEALEDAVVETHSDVNVLEQSFDVVDDDQRDWTVVGVVEDLLDDFDLSVVCLADEVLA